MLAEHARHLERRLEPRAAGLPAPAAQKAVGRGGRAAFPELLEILLEQVGADSAQVQLEQVGELGLLVLGEVVGALEQQPAAALERFLALLLEFAGLGGADLVDHLAELAGDMEAVEHMEGLAGALADHVEVGLPHVGAVHLEPGGALLAEPREEALEGLDLAFLPDPQQAAAVGIDLVHQDEVFVAGLPGDLVDADGGDAGESDARGVLPREALGPRGEEPAEGFGGALLAVGPRHALDLDRDATGAIDAAQAVDEEGGQAEQRHELEAARREAVVAGTLAAAAGAHRAAVGARLHVDDHVEVSLAGLPLGRRPRRASGGSVAIDGFGAAGGRLGRN